jgi:hypothetical protein
LQEANSELSQSLEKAAVAEQNLRTLQLELDETKQALSAASLKVKKECEDGEHSDRECTKSFEFRWFVFRC